MKNIYRVEMHPPIIYTIKTEVNNLNIVVTLIVVHRQYPQAVFQNLQNIHNKKVIFKTVLFLLVI